MKEFVYHALKITFYTITHVLKNQMNVFHKIKLVDALLVNLDSELITDYVKKFLLILNVQKANTEIHLVYVFLGQSITVKNIYPRVDNAQAVSQDMNLMQN